MESKRKDDEELKSRFRTDRMIKSEGVWYYCTREGDLQGPFNTRSEAEHHLEKYIRIMGLELNQEYELQPVA